MTELGELLYSVGVGLGISAIIIIFALGMTRIVDRFE